MARGGQQFEAKSFGGTSPLTLDVRFGSLADMGPSRLEVRFGQQQTSRHSFDHLVGTGKDCFGNGNPERFCGLKVYDQFEPRWAFNGEVGGFGTAQNATDVFATPAKHIGQVWPVGNKTSGAHVRPIRISRRQASFGREFSNPHSVGKTDRTRQNDERSARHFVAASKASSKVVAFFNSTAWVSRAKLPATRASSRNCAALILKSPRTATRDALGRISLRICRCFPLNSERSRNIPVMLPPGRAMLAANPASTGSISRSIPVIGIVRVASFAAAKAEVPRAKITSTLRSASSDASFGKSSGWS